MMVDRIKNFFTIKNRDRELTKSFRNTISSFNRKFSLSNDEIKYDDLKSLYSFLSEGGLLYKHTFDNFNNSGLDIAFKCVTKSPIDEFNFSITSIDCMHHTLSITERTDIYVRTGDRGEKYIVIHVVTIEQDLKIKSKVRSNVFEYVFQDSISVDGYNKISTCGNSNTNAVIRSMVETIQRVVLALLKTCVRV